MTVNNLEALKKVILIVKLRSDVRTFATNYLRANVARSGWTLPDLQFPRKKIKSLFVDSCVRSVFKVEVT